MMIFLWGAQIVFDIIAILMFCAFILAYDHMFANWLREADKNDKLQAAQDTRLATLEKIERGTTEFNKAELDAWLRSLPPPEEP